MTLTDNQIALVMAHKAVGYSNQQISDETGIGQNEIDDLIIELKAEAIEGDALVIFWEHILEGYFDGRVLDIYAESIASTMR